MVPIVLKLAIWPLFGAIATILASATANGGLAVESRPAPFAPIPSATPHSDSAKPSATTDRYLSTSAGADGFSTSVASIASTNISFLPSAGHAPSTGELTWSVTELAVLRPTETSGTLLRAHADADVSISTVSIASAGDNTASIDANQSHLASLTVFQPAAHQHRNLKPDSMPDLDTLPRARADTDSSIGTVIIASAGDNAAASAASGVVNGDITRIFSSRHSTSIAISRALASTADADGASNTDCALTSTADADGPADGTPGDHRAYHCMDMKNSPKYKKAKKTIPESPGPQAWLTGKLHDGRIRSVRSPPRRAPLPATPIAKPLQCGRP